VVDDQKRLRGVIHEKAALQIHERGGPTGWEAGRDWDEGARWWLIQMKALRVVVYRMAEKRPDAISGGGSQR